jgi:D-alanyl-D-alanine carboxypeptidase
MFKMKISKTKLMINPLIYFLTTFILSWSLFGMLVLKGDNNAQVVSVVFFILAMMGPGITAILFTCISRSKKEIMDCRIRTAEVKRLSKGWLAVIIVFPFLIKALAGIIDGFSGGIGLRWVDPEEMMLSAPANLLSALAGISLIPIFQELGWRGYAQDLLQEKRSALSASIIVGMAWCVFTIPVYFIPSTYLTVIGFPVFQSWIHFAGLIFMSIAISWVYVNTNRSILTVILLHAMIILAGKIMYLSDMGERVYTLCLFSAVITIWLGFGKKMQVNPRRLHALRMRQGILFAVALTGLVSILWTSKADAGNRQTMKSGFETILRERKDEFGFPGATAAYILPDGTVEAVATGQADTEYHIPMTTESRMLAASIGKTFVAATALALVQEDRLTLDTPISEWLAGYPWFRQIPNHEVITLRQLLNHSAGIRNHVEMPEFQAAFSRNWQNPQNPFSPEELVSFIVDQPALFKPGEGWYYSDTGYILVGLIIEKVTGNSYYEEVTRRFLSPLSLDLTTPSDRRALSDLASGYLAADNAFGLPVKTTAKPGTLAWHPGIEWTGGGLVSNPKDLVRWAKSLYEGQVMEGNYSGTLLQTVPISPEHPEIRYGLGVAVHEEGRFGPTYGHGGWIPGYCSSLRYYPEFGIAVALQINSDIGMDEGIEEIEEQLAAVIISALDKELNLE